MHAILNRDYFVYKVTISRDVQDVQNMVILCNEFHVPVWAFSIGRNTGYGDVGLRVPGSICLNLGKHMNKVLEVNPDDRYALLEPDVTYLDLHEYLEKHGLREKVWMDVPYLGGGSFIGNAIVRGVGCSPYGG